jgi:nucleotide-binding universal stress UspA family protein
MMEIKRILCPTDLTPDSGQALRYAVALANAYESELFLCHRAELEIAASAGAIHLETRRKFMTEHESKKIFESVLHKMLKPEESATLKWQGLMIDGNDVGEAIARTASECGADMIVMRSRRRPHRAAILGSTAESVCRTAPCPVLVTHCDERDWVQPLSKNISIEKVLVPYDFSDYAELALKYALSFAQEYQAELHLLHVLPSHTVNEPEIAWSPNQTDSAYHNAARRLQRVVPAEAQLWCDVKTAVSEGHAYREILHYAEKNAIDLISIGAHGVGFGMRALFGSNVDRVLRQAPCPVLVARHLKPAVSTKPDPQRQVTSAA